MNRTVKEPTFQFCFKIYLLTRECFYGKSAGYVRLMDKNRANVKKKCFSLGYQSSRFKFRLNKADRRRSKPAWLKRLEPWDGFWETIQRWTERANLNNYKWIWSPREINVAFHKEKNIFIQPPNCKLCKFYRDSLWTKRPFLLFHPLNRPYMQQTMNKRAKLNNSQMVWLTPSGD